MPLLIRHIIAIVSLPMLMPLRLHDAAFAIMPPYADAAAAAFDIILDAIFSDYFSSFSSASSLFDYFFSSSLSSLSFFFFAAAIFTMLFFYAAIFATLPYAAITATLPPPDTHRFLHVFISRFTFFYAISPPPPIVICLIVCYYCATRLLPRVSADFTSRQPITYIFFSLLTRFCLLPPLFASLLISFI